MPTPDPERRMLAVYMRRNPTLTAALNTRGAPAGIIMKRDVERYYTTLDAELRWLREQRILDLDADETAALCDALKPPRMNGWRDLRPDRALVSAVRAGISVHGLHHKHQISGEHLVDVLNKLSPLQALAVIDAAERVWQHPDDAGILKTVGLLA